MIRYTLIVIAISTTYGSLSYAEDLEDPGPRNLPSLYYLPYSPLPKKLDIETILRDMKQFDRSQNPTLHFLRMQASIGQSLTSDSRSASEIWKFAANEGSINPDLYQGIKFLNGWSEEKNYEKALNLISMIAKSGDPQARFALGMVFKLGLGVEQNDDKAKENFLAAANTWKEQSSVNGGEPDHYLGYLYLNGLGVEQDPEQAEFYFRRGAEFDFAPSYHSLGKLYEAGCGLKPNKEAQRIASFRIAANAGFAPSEYNLGKYYEEESDYTNATIWFAKAAAQGYPKAQRELGRKYIHKRNNLSDNVVALKWLTLASEQGDFEAQVDQGVLLNSMTHEEIEISETLAASWHPNLRHPEWITLFSPAAPAFPQFQSVSACSD